MSRIIIISQPPPPPNGLMASTMADNAVSGPQFDIQCQDQELSFTEQAALLRAAADQLDDQQTNASTEA